MSGVLLFLAAVTYAQPVVLTLRASYHESFLRIVLEGDESVIEKRLVYQRGNDVLVSFPNTDFSVRTETENIDYTKMGQDTLILSPGEFRGLKVFTLKDPSRLVIDIYVKEKKGAFAPLAPGRKERKAAPALARSVVIDPGHGGYEDGIVRDGSKEKNTVLDIARKLEALAGSATSPSYLTRGSDQFMSLSERVRYANSRDAAVFISIHIGNHKGIVLYTPVITRQVSEKIMPFVENQGQAGYTGESMTLLRAMKTAIAADFGSDMASVMPMPYSVISRVGAAALIVELPSFEDADYTDDFTTAIANTLHKGLYVYEEIRTQ